MLSVNLIIIILIMLFIIMLMGMFITNFLMVDKDSIALNFTSGLLLLFSLFQVIALIAIFLQIDFTTLKVIYSLVVMLVLASSLFLNYKRIMLWCQRFRQVDIKSKKNGMLIPLFVIMIIFVLSNIFWEFGVWGDDTYYVGTSLTTIETNSMFQYNPYTGRPYPIFPWRYVLSPYPIFHAYLSEIFGIHPTIMIRLIVPIISKIFLICVFYCIGKMLFGLNKEKIYSFLFYVLLLTIFSGIGLGSPGFAALLYLHMGKMLLYVALLPLCFYIYYRLFSEKSNLAEWLLLLCLVIGSSLVSSMSVILITMCVGILGITHLIKTRDIKRVVFMAICCIPNIVLGLLYALNTSTMEIYIPM